MKLRNKVLIAIGMVWVIFLIFTYFGSKHLLLHSFVQLEKDQINQDLARVDQTLNQINYSLHTFTSDWSHWDDAYLYIQGKEPWFVRHNLNISAFQNSTINLMMYWQNDDKLAIGLAVDTQHGKIVPYPAGLDKYIHPESMLLSDKTAKKDISGYILLPDGVMMIAANAITDSDQKLPSIGTLIAGRFISPEILQKIQDQTKLNLRLILLNQIKQDPELLQRFQKAVNTPSGHTKKPVDKNTLHGYTVIRDIYNKPIAMFEITTPRSIHLTGTQAINYFLISFIVLAIIFSCLMLWMLHILVIRRLEKLDHDIAEISKRNEVFRRVDATGNDELSSVSHQINKMMNTIEASHTQLEKRVEERTEELQKTNAQLQQEIIERQLMEKELIVHKEHLARLAHYDSLTSLPNRVFFNEMLNKTINHAHRHRKMMAILFLDLDRFKNINDALGHTAGDGVLKEIANRFSTVLRAGDVLARLGGDEFIILLNDILHPKFASPVADKLLQICAQPIHINNHELFVTTSIGICIYPNDGTSLEDLQRNADMAMYKAKKSGGDIFEYFTKEMNIQAHEHIQLEAALRKAISNNEFVLYYQPKLNLADGSMNGVEALIRWDHPEHGIINPGKFIPLAEETGLIMQIGEWVLREACRANKSWQEQGYQPITIAVNLSAKQFRHQDLTQLISNILAETKLDPQYLELEITETAMMDDLDAAIAKLRAIQHMGVNIAVDDFGTGYTSITYLKQFPISVLKIDRNFIKGIPENQNDIAITSAVIALAHSLNIKVVAEGVESAEQLQYLADHNCDIVQGYYLSRPVPESKIILQFQKNESETEKFPL